MVQLLVSVRDSAEARLALECGVDLLDVKEPNRGALGAADLSVIRHVIEQVAGRRPVSMAAGELRQWDATQGPQIPSGVDYLKLGLADCVEIPTWPQLWRRAVESIPIGTHSVAVVYADWCRARAPRPMQVLEEAVRLGCPFLLVDTFDKSAGGLLDCWPQDELGSFVASVRRYGLRLVLAGSLSEATIPEVLAFGPDYVGVRGAVCRNGRSGPMEAFRIRRLAGLVASPAAPSASNCLTTPP